ncbi:MAG: hypothetical protein QOD07_2001 [Frankiaceae bacterium]|jgi:hypothetical protein|nr:hypothetical protein [Frankiaceae bacterium]
MAGPDMTGGPSPVDVERRLRDLLTDDHLTVRVPARALDAVHTGVRRRRRRARLASATAVVAVAATVGAVATPALLHRSSRAPHDHVVTAKPEPWTSGPATALPTALRSPSAMAVSGGVVWVAGSGVLARVDATSRRVTSMPTGAVSDLAATPRHLWVALRPANGTARSCSLELHETNSGSSVSTYTLPCDADGATGPVVTANGPRAWVASDDGTRTHLRLYTANTTSPPVERVLPGRLAGPRPLAIGGTSVYVVTSGTDGAVLHRLSATDLTPLATIAVPGARLVAYGSDQLFVADAASVAAYRPDLTARRTFVAGAVSALTTGDDLVWCDPGGGKLSGLDAHAGTAAATAAFSPGPVGLLRADGTLLWSVQVYGGRAVVLSAQRAA